MKRALVLSGGGAKGGFQVGALKWLIKHKGWDFDVMAGVSVGALNATMVALGKFDRLETIWDTIENKSVYEGSGSEISLFLKAITGANAIYSNQPLLELIRREITPGDIERYSHNQKLCWVGAVELNSGEYFKGRPTDTEFIKFLLASTAMPVVWPPTQIGRSLFVDGGVRNISPLGDVIDQEPDHITIINCNPKVIEPYSGKLNGLIKIGKRSLEIALNELALNDIDMFLEMNHLAKQNPGLTKKNGNPLKYFDYTLIEPVLGLGDTLDFSQNSVQMRKSSGYLRAQTLVP